MGSAFSQNRKRSAASFCAAALFACTGVWSSLASAQLNDKCIVNVLNRTVQVGANGNWALPNVPSNQGKVRARATCVGPNNTTISGQSEYFTVLTNRVVPAGTIVFQNLEPIPALLRFASSAPILISTAGATAQLAVTAVYPNSTTRDVTAAVSGTNYSSTTPSVAMVGPDGRVTAVSSGFALISARKDGAVAVTRVLVNTGGDVDGDGMPDAFETANGLNPSDPIDALEDQDKDGLSALDEYLKGTGVRNPDSDGDGLEDGEEALPGDDGYITDPLLTDTDDDGLSDFVEAAVQSNPTDPNDHNFGAALTSLSVTPSVLGLVLNTAVTEQTGQQLQVTGVLIDGSTVNLTSTARGTTYASSNLSICNFGLDPGRVYGTSPGACQITVRNGSFQRIVSAFVTQFDPKPVSRLAIPGFANNVEAAGGRAYVAAGDAGLVIVDARTPASPVVSGSLNTAGTAIDVRLNGTLAYVADGANGLVIADVSSPFFPTLAGSVDTPGIAQDVQIQGSYAYVADGSAGLQIIDTSNPANPVLVGQLGGIGTAKGVDVQGTIAAVGTSTGVRVVDVSNPNAPVLRGSRALSDVRDVVIAGNFVHVAAYSNGHVIVDITDPAQPVNAGQVTGFIPRDVVLAPPLAFFADVFYANAIPYVNVSDPRAPAFQNIISLTTFGDDDHTGIALDAQFVYVTAESFISGDFGTTGDTALLIAQYKEITDQAGVAPSVALVQPNGQTTPYYSGETVSVQATATDDVAVLAVELYVNGVSVGTDFQAPYTFQYTTPNNFVGLLTFAARATDLGSNVAESSGVTVDVRATHDGLFCNGLETCSHATGCIPGTPPPLNDGVGCTVDACNEATDTITHVPVDSVCTDGSVCTGIESCSPATGCVAGTPLDPSDGQACTADSCDPILGVAHAPVVGVACGGGRVCTPTGECEFPVCVHNDSRTRTIACGATLGYQLQTCDGGQWVDSGACTPGSCLEGSERETSCGTANQVQIERCTSGQWASSGGCACAAGSLDVNGNGAICEGLAQISYGRNSSCAVTTGGRLYCWGNSTTGTYQLGNGSGNPKWKPFAVDAATTWTMVSVGSTHACAIKDGNLYCWGDGANGRTGLGTQSIRTVPTQVAGANWTTVTAGYAHTCGIRDGILHCWGSNSVGQIGQPSTVTQLLTPTVVFAGAAVFTSGTSNATFVIGTNGALYATGENIDGALGDGTLTNRFGFVQIGLQTGWNKVASGGDQNVSFFGDTTCAIRAAGELWCWGSNNSGAIGDGTKTRRLAPVRVGTNSDWSEVIGTSLHMCGRRGGALYCWGANPHGELGTGNRVEALVPAQVGTATDWNGIAVFDRTSLSGGTCGLRAGRLYCWGRGLFYYEAEPLKVDPFGDWQSLTLGVRHGCAVRTGRVYCWGQNNEGQLGDGTQTARVGLTQVGTDTDWDLVNAGAFHTCGIRHGELYCWGANGKGQLGDGTLTRRTSPVRVGSDSGWDLAAGGSQHTCGLRAGRIYCWGWNGDRQLGDGTSIDRSTPVQSGTSNDYSVVAAGTNSSCGIRTGRLYCWGSGATGANGVPTQFGTATNWSDVALGDSTSCGIRDGSLYCVGGGGLGLAGVGSQVVVPLTQVGTFTNWTQAKVGIYVACAVRRGELWCWGWNDVGAVGIGTSFDTHDSGSAITTPRRVGSLVDWTSATVGNHNNTSTGYGDFACGTNASGRHCWGSEDLGFGLGVGDTNTVPRVMLLR